MLAFALAMTVGTIVAAARVSPIPPLRAAGTVWVETWRNTPLAALMIFWYFGGPKIGLTYPRFTTAAVVLGCYTSAFVGETIRSGINAVAGGQAEAARSIGLTFPQSLRFVVLPQAMRTVVAPLGSIFIAHTKNSSVSAVIGVGELTFMASRLTTDTAQPIAVFLGAAAAYLLLTLPSGALVGVLERRVAIRR